MGLINEDGTDSRGGLLVSASTGQVPHIASDVGLNLARQDGDLDLELN